MSHSKYPSMHPTQSLNRSYNADSYNLSMRTIVANEDLKKKMKTLSRIKPQTAKRKSKIMNNIDKYNTTKILNKTQDDLRKTRYVLGTLLDDGKTTMLMNKSKQYDIYLLPKTSVYYRLEKEEFKEKAFLVLKYYDKADVMIYASTKSPRPNKYNSEL